MTEFRQRVRKAVYEHNSLANRQVRRADELMAEAVEKGDAKRARRASRIRISASGNLRLAAAAITALGHVQKAKMLTQRADQQVEQSLGDSTLALAFERRR